MSYYFVVDVKTSKEKSLELHAALNIHLPVKSADKFGIGIANDFKKSNNHMTVISFGD